MSDSARTLVPSCTRAALSAPARSVRVGTGRSLPYGIEVDTKGRAWVNEFGTNKIATVDPRTFEYKTYDVPNAGARPRRIAVTSGDQIYWGDYARGYLGRLDPATGAIEEWALPAGPAALPYAMATDDRDVFTHLRALTFVGRDELAELEATHRARPDERLAQRRLADALVELVHG